MTACRLSVGVAIAAVAVGCGGGGDDVDRDGYVKENLALLRTLPSFPGARLGRVEALPYKANEQSDAVAGYWAARTDRLPTGVRPAAVIAYYRRELRREWRIDDISKAPSISLRKGDAYLHVLAGGGVVDVEVDHDCYKGGSSPTCGGP
jgi:hypothetical protein